VASVDSGYGGPRPADETRLVEHAGTQAPAHTWASPLPRLLGSIDVAAESSVRDPQAAVLLARSLPDFFKAWAAVRVPVGERLTRSELQRRIGEDLAALDEAIARQVDVVLHQPAFQQLEATWRGLWWLTGQAEGANGDSATDGVVKIRLLPVTKRELQRDQESAVEFDRSQIWKKVYEEEFGTAGGTPYGLLVCNHEFSHLPDDVRLLKGLADVAMGAFAPLLASPSAKLLGLESMADLEMHLSADVMRTSPEYVNWRGLRERDESRFVGMPLPRVLARVPYDGLLGAPEAAGCGERSWAQRGFRYREHQEGPDFSGKLWMSAVWALAGVIIREFGRSGWFADIRGASRNLAGGGLVDDLPTEVAEGFQTAHVRGPVEVFVTDNCQLELEECGFIPLCSSQADGKAVFHGNSSLHVREKFDNPSATINAGLSSMLQYVLCVSRFAHYLKVIGRDKLGGFQEASDLQMFLSNWINEYVTPDDDASPEARARMPLRAAQVEVVEEVASPGDFRVVMRFQPHFQIDRLDATLRLVSTIKKPK
jgi:type VI secretion system protein ImpD